jgi:hypothetical protein
MERSEGLMRPVTIAAALIISLTCISLSPSIADPSPSPSPTVALDSYKVALEQYKHDREVFMAALRDRANKMQNINNVFKAAVDKANSDARAAMPAATTPLQKTTISSIRRSAIDAAINARDISIAGLGPMPTPPVEPVRPEKQQSNNGKGEKSRR